MELNESLIEEFYKTHTLDDVCKEFHISYYVARKILLKRGVEIRHVNSAKDVYNEHLELIADRFTKESLLDFYSDKTSKEASKELNVSIKLFNDLLATFQIKPHTTLDSKKILYTRKYGSYKAGKEIESRKAVESTDQVERQRKVNATNQVKYGGNSPFSSSIVRDKAKRTLKERYDVENPFQIPEVVNKIRNNQIEKYGGVGFASKYLSDKYKSTMMDLYGVEYGCLTDNCINSSNGSLSSPNVHFREFLINNGITDFQGEFVIDNYRYDFIIGNILIEVNPSYTHNSTFPYRNSDKILPSDYHLRKSEVAREHGYRCVCIWDWDNLDKIIQLLKNRDSIYARSCEIKLIDKHLSEEFIDKFHLQGYCRSDIDIGLFYGEDLVSVMTFGKPRYNKNYQYELIRYCSSKNIIGGSERLFKYFINIYDPSSIISYCDLSKFNGDTYKKLGFSQSKRKPIPSKHWYNMKTKRHITDNLLRQRGFDQLFGTNYGKFSDNRELMIKEGFVEIYDCGQDVFTYKK